MTFDLILIGLAITLEPLPLTAYILLLSTAGGTRKGLAYLIGWVLTLTGVVVLTLLLTGGKPLKSGSAPSTAALLLRIVIGLGLLFVAWRQRLQRGRPASKPAWIAKLDSLNTLYAMALGFLLQPWPLVAAGAATVTAADLSEPSSIASLFLFGVLASASYLVMQLYVTISPAPARARLDRVNEWISSHRDDVIIVLSVSVGLWLIAHSTYELAT